jgi:hypothetical protein
MHLCYPGFPEEMFSLYQHNFDLTRNRPQLQIPEMQYRSIKLSTLCLPDNLVHGLGEVVNVVGI